MFIGRPSTVIVILLDGRKPLPSIVAIPSEERVTLMLGEVTITVVCVNLTVEVLTVMDVVQLVTGFVSVMVCESVMVWRSGPWVAERTTPLVKATKSITSATFVAKGIPTPGRGNA